MISETQRDRTTATIRRVGLRVGNDAAAGEEISREPSESYEYLGRLLPQSMLRFEDFVDKYLGTRCSDKCSKHLNLTAPIAEHSIFTLYLLLENIGFAKLESTLFDLQQFVLKKIKGGLSMGIRQSFPQSNRRRSSN